MRQLLQNLHSGEVIFQDIPCPEPGANQLVVRTRLSLISAGTERMLVDFGKAGYLEKARQQPEKVKQVLDKVRSDGLAPTVQAVRNKLGEPIPLGYSNVGTVVAAGRDVEGFAAGDRVVSNGPHAEVAVVSASLAAHVPDNVSDEAASFTVVSAIGLQGVRLLEPTLGETFGVFGLGLIGLISVQLLKLSGCRVVGFDLDPARVDLAQQYGAAAFVLDENFDAVRAAMEATDGRGLDGALIAASTKSDELIHQAAESCRKRGRIVLTGVTGLNLRRADFYEKELTFQVSCSYGPGRYDPAFEQQGVDYPLPFVRWTAKRNFDAVLELLSDGKLDISNLVSSRFAFTDAAKAYEQVSGGGAIGVILEYEDSAADPLAEKTVIHASPKSVSRSAAAPCVALIGAGGFARSTLGPAIKRCSPRLKWAASRTGLSASTLATKLEFERSTTSLDEVFADDELNTVFITTRHDSHAALVLRAIEHGKNVFVEKPLCLTEDELQTVAAAYRKSPLHFMLGFNRRYAPLVVKMKELLRTRSEPLSMVYMVNAGAVPESHWLLDEAVGGGRLLGEGCHFIDLLADIAGSEIVEVSAAAQPEKAGKKDVSFSVSLKFKDGSIGAVHYFTNGSKKFAKERISIFSDGRVLELDNFRSLRGAGFSGFTRKRALSQDKGHNAAIETFLGAIEQGKAPAMDFESAVKSMEAVFAARKALEQNIVVDLSEL